MSQRFKITIDVAYEGDISDPSRLLGSVQDNIKGLLDPHVEVGEFSVDIAEIVELQKLLVDDGKAKCPACGNADIKNFHLHESTTRHAVRGLVGNLVVVDSYGTPECGDFGEAHLECGMCEEDLDLPDGFKFDYR